MNALTVAKRFKGLLFLEAMSTLDLEMEIAPI